MLGRSAFAQVLARSIDQLPVARDGFVIGLVGGWGAGKSSVVELTLRYMEHGQMIKDCAAEGQTMDFARLEEMASQFRLASPTIERFLSSGLDTDLWDRNHSHREFLRACGTADNAALARKYWRLKRAVESDPRNVVVRFSPWLFPGKTELASALLSEMARTVGERLGNEPREAFAAMLSRISQAVPLVGAAADVATSGAFGGLFSAAFNVSDQLARRLTTGPTLEQARDRLRKTLAELETTKIVVVIDDLDRLTPGEAVEMVSLVKGLGDLPNVVYLLCYDEARLCRLVNLHLKIDGHDYLQKIVQYPVHLPILDGNDISRLLQSDLQDILDDMTQDDRSRLNNAWFLVLKHYLKTPRDVRRLTNAFSVATSGLADHTDPIDLLVLEAIRVNEPELYGWIRQNLDELAV